jgi:outer membrane protein TolC
MVYRYIFFILFLLSGIAVKAQESMLTDVSYPYLEKLIAAAKVNYPKMKAYDHNIKIAKMNVSKAKLDWLNILSFIYLYNPSSTNNSTTANNSILSGFQAGFSLSIGSILQKPGMIKAAKEEVTIAKLGQEEYVLSIEAQVQQRYFMYVQTQALLNWKTKDLQHIESTIKDMKYKFEKGEETFENYNKGLTAYSAGVQSKIQTEGAYLLAKSNLEEIIGAKLETIK